MHPHEETIQYIPLHAAGATPKQHHRFFFSARLSHLARSTDPTTTAPAATETRREAPVFEIRGDRASVLDVGGEGDVDDARSFFREYFAAEAPPPETR